MRKAWVTAGAIAGAVAFSANCAAADWTIGAGAGVAPDYEGSSDYEPIPLWNIKASKLYHDDTYVQLFGTKLNSNLLPHDNFRLGISGQFVLRRNNVDDSAVDRLSKTDDGFMLGAIVGYDFDLSKSSVFGIEFDARYDVKGDIGGLYTGRLKYSGQAGQNWIVTAGVETTYATEDYMDEFFGVTPTGTAASGLSTYDPDSGFKDVGINTSLTYKITNSWSFTGIVKYTRLVGDADDSSPITDRGSENQLVSGLLVNFHF